MHPLSSTEIEQTLVLEGSIEDHDGITTAGDYIWRKPGFLHDNKSPGGAVWFAAYRKPNLYSHTVKEIVGFQGQSPNARAGSWR